MTSTLSAPPATSRVSAADPRHRRPLVLIAILGGMATAAATLVIALAIGVIGWFLTDAGAHGAPRDALRTGALAWLMGHGSGVTIEGTVITAVPLGITLVCAWAMWRIGYRVGDSTSGHGPDSDAIADGARDWTVPLVTTLFAAGYLVVAVLTAALASTPETNPSTGRVIAWVLGLALVVAGPSIAVGTGRAAIWAALLPLSLRAALMTCLKIATMFVLVSLLTLAIAFAVDLTTAINMMSALHTSPGAVLLYAVVSVAVLPNAGLFAGSYLLGPGFAVGTGTVVAPTAVTLGPLPMFPLLAALPEDGTPAGWVMLLLLVPPLVAAIAAARTQRLYPTLRWEEGAVRGCGGGILAGVLVTILAVCAGGVVGPGRMADVGPFAGQVLFHAITTMGLGGLVGGLAMTWWQRRTYPDSSGIAPR